jgi:hypothetical protein
MRFKHEILSEISRKIENLNKSYLVLSRAHHQLISLLIPEVKPTKKELEAIRRKEKLIPLSKVK